MSNHSHLQAPEIDPHLRGSLASVALPPLVAKYLTDVPFSDMTPPLDGVDEVDSNLLPHKENKK
jgi:hypothetical protein